MITSPFFYKFSLSASHLRCTCALRENLSKKQFNFCHFYCVIFVKIIIQILQVIFELISIFLARKNYTKRRKHQGLTLNAFSFLVFITCVRQDTFYRGDKISLFPATKPRAQFNLPPGLDPPGFSSAHNQHLTKILRKWQLIGR